MNYLKYIEHAAENLQFFLWHRDYESRWNDLSESEKALASEWTAEQADAELAGGAGQARTKRMKPEVAAILKDTDFADGAPKATLDRVDPFNTPDKSSDDGFRDPMSDYGSSMGDDKTLHSSTVARSVAGQAFSEAGLKWKPCEWYAYSQHNDG
jgi:hypothetical protein